MNKNELRAGVGRWRYWDDIRMYATASRLVSPAGRINYDFTNVGLGFQTNCIYPTDYAVFSSQMSHRYEEGRELDTHIHWDQQLNALPNWCITYRFTTPGAPFGAWTGPILLATNQFAWVAGGLHQITDAAARQAGTGLRLSFIIEVKLFRDTTNVSGLFAGADPYAATALVKEADLHFPINSMGSWAEYAKWG